MFSSMPTFTRESKEWLENEDWYHRMDALGQEHWLEWRETCVMDHADPLQQRKNEQFAMASHDIVEASHLHWNSEDDNDGERLLVLAMWNWLGGGKVVRSRLMLTDCPRTPMRTQLKNRHSDSISEA